VHVCIYIYMHIYICNIPQNLPMRHRPSASAYVSIRPHTSAYNSIRQHTSAYGVPAHAPSTVSIHEPAPRQVASVPKGSLLPRRPVPVPVARIRQHTSAYVSIRQHTSEYVSIRQHTLASSPAARIRQHTSAHVSIRQMCGGIRPLAI
jgi:hypothetical protein